MAKKHFVFDLDVTLALVDHRRSLLDSERPDWHSFNEASLLDPPSAAVVSVARALARDYELWIVSGRCVTSFQLTCWLFLMIAIAW